MGRLRVDLQTAAELLGISSDAVRKRAKRGNMPYETGADGKLYVWVDNGETSDYPAGEHLPAGELVEELRNRVRSLERQVEAEREANRENRRIIAALTSRIPQLEAPRDEPQASETPADSPEGTHPPADLRDAQEAVQRRSWWRRLFDIG